MEACVTSPLSPWHLGAGVLWNLEERTRPQLSQGDPIYLFFWHKGISIPPLSSCHLEEMGRNGGYGAKFQA